MWKSAFIIFISGYCYADMMPPNPKILLKSTSAWSASQDFSSITIKGISVNAAGSLPLPGGDTGYIQNTTSLQSGSTFFVSSGTANNLNVSTLVITDIFLMRDTADILSQRNGSKSQTYNLYGSYSDSANYDRIQLGLTGSNANILFQLAGTGTDRNMNLGIGSAGGGGSFNILTANTTRVSFGSTGSTTFYSNLIPSGDNLFDLGQNTTPRTWRTAYFGTSVGIGLGLNQVPSSSLDINGGSITVRGSGAGLIVSGGNIGFGTTNPSFILGSNGLHLSGGNSEIRNTSTVNGNQASYSFDVKTGAGVAQQYNLGCNILTTTSGFELYDKTAGADRMYVATSGNVGFGTTNPSSKLEIFNGSVTIQGTNSGLIVRSGNVGIGTQNPLSTVDIVGGSLTIRGTGAISGGISASTYTVRGTNIINSTFTIPSYAGFVMVVTSGSLSANTAKTISASDLGLSVIGLPVCCELEGVNTAGTSIRLKDTLGTTSFQVYNSDVTNVKKYVCHVPGRP